MVMENKRTFETLDEVFEHIDDPGFLEALNSYIEEMPCNRETVDQLIDAADSWDMQYSADGRRTHKPESKVQKNFRCSAFG